ncbi:MAG: CusA/CzcA family heavy metal efflux RND transporter [Polyangia bacterium]
MSAVVKWSAENPLLAAMLAIAMVIAGVLSLRSLPIDALPDVTNVQVQIVTQAETLSASEVEVQITQPIERTMSGLPGLTTTRSISKLGISVVTLIFDDDTDVYFARQQVGERLAELRSTIPPELGSPELGPVTTALGEIYMFELAGEGRSLEELRTIVEWQIAPKLRQVHGVVEVLAFGGATKHYRVTVDPARLAAYHLSVADVRHALAADNRLAGGGYIDRAGEQIVVRGDARFRGLEDISATVVKVEQGAPIRVGQLADVDTGPGLRQGAMTRDGRGEIVGASVFMLKGSNSRQVVADVKAQLQTLKLPAQVKIAPYYDRGEFIDHVLETVFENLSIGAVIVVLCLLLTLGSIRAGLLVSGAIPFSMLVGITGLHLIGYSGNVMSLGAVDFGIIVEGAVLIVEHAMSVRGHDERRARQRALVEAMQAMARSATFGVLITILTFLPLATLQQVEGKMFRPVVLSLCFMLFGALVYALVVVPLLVPYVLGGLADHGDPPLVRWLKRRFEPLLVRVLTYPKLTLGIAFVSTAVLFSCGTRIGADFLPRIFEGAYAIDAQRPPSVSLPEAIALSAETERALNEIPEVKTVVNRIGRPDGAVDPAGPESSDVFVILKPKKEWRKGIDEEQLAAEIDAKLAARVPATLMAISQPIEMRINDIVAGIKGEVAVKVFGDDLATMGAAAEKIRRAVASVRGAADVKVEPVDGLPAITVHVDRARAGRIGVSPGAILDVVTMARAGLPVGVVREGERVFPLTLKLGGDAISSTTDLERLPIAAGDAALIPLGLVAHVEQADSVFQVGREQLRRRIVVQANVRGRDLVGFVAEVQKKVAELALPRSVDVVWGGQFQNFERAKGRLTILVPMSLVVIGLMLVITFGRWSLAGIALLTLPFALAGGAFALFVRGLPFSIPAGVGFIALAGVSVLTSIVVIQAFLGSKRQGSPEDRVRHASMESFRAPISTALVAAVGFIPAAMAHGTGAEVQRPLATVVIGGLLFSMVLSLLSLPAMLLLWERRGGRGAAGAEDGSRTIDEDVPEE